MGIYSPVLELFDRNGIRDNSSLEAILQKYPEQGGDQWEIWTEQPFEDHPLGSSFCIGLDEVARQIEFYPNDIGIQLFSLSVEQRVKEENIRKALFLSRTASIFTEHVFSYTTEGYNTEESIIQYNQSYWNISHNFIRDVFKYRKILESDQLIILPRSVIKTNPYYGTSKENLSLLERMEKTKVFSFGVDSQFIDAIIKRYKMNHQLISLPSLNMPWIEQLNLETILKVKNDYSISLDSFQKAYHNSVLEYITNHRSLDFARISTQIHQDLITPRVEEIEKKYRRIISLHKSLVSTGAIVSLIPISGVILSGTLLNQILLSDIIGLIPSTIAGLVTTVSTNRIHRRNAIQALEDNAYYILWKLNRAK